MTIETRFWEKVDRSGECWSWKAGVFRPSGYGAFYLGGQNRLAHRVAYEMVHGPIPEGLVLDHLCRVRHCVRPSHLEAVTQRVNLLRGVGAASRNAQKTHCPQGHSYSHSNTRVYSGKRHCDTCIKIRNRAA